MTDKILHLIGQLRRGGAEKQLYCVSTALRARGWPQAVVSFSSGGAWEQRLQDAGIPVLEVPSHRVKPWRLWRLWRIVRRERPGIVLSWSDYVATYAHWLRGVGRPRQVFNVRIDLTRNARSGAAGATLRRCRGALEGADRVVSNSRRNLETLQEHGVRLPPNEVIYNIVEGHGRARPAEPVNVPRVVAAGSLIPRKGYDLLLRALGHLAEAGMSFELLLGGEGPERQSLENLARQLGIADRVKFLGEVEDLASLLAASQLLVHPSHAEGLSNTVLEAMGEGLPVVASAVGATPEIIEDGESGLLVPPGSLDDLTSAVGRLLADPQLRARLGVSGRQVIERRCNAAVIAGQYERLFRELLAK
jgi:glycosyltransferase involved in cell wall biosynthesis